jgi:hypothetical protein
MNGDVVDDMVACGRAPHGLHGAVEPDHSVISRSSTVSIASSGRAPSGPVMRRIMAAPSRFAVVSWPAMAMVTAVMTTSSSSRSPVSSNCAAR